MREQSGGEDKGNFQKIGEGLGGLVGQAADSMAGMFGGMLSDMGGWWSESTRPQGSGSVSASFGSERDGECRRHFTAQGSAQGRERSYEETKPLYELGHLAGQNPEYRGRGFDQVEMDLQRGWGDAQRERHGAWPDVRGFVQFGYEGASRSSGAGSGERRPDGDAGFQASGSAGGSGYGAAGSTQAGGGGAQGGLHASGTTPGGTRMGLDVEAGATRGDGPSGSFTAGGGTAGASTDRTGSPGSASAAGGLHASAATPGGTQARLDVEGGGADGSGAVKASGELRRDP